MATIPVSTPDGSYPAHVVEAGDLGVIGELLARTLEPVPSYLVCDPEVDRLYGKAVAGSLTRAGFHILGVHRTPMGEEAKTLAEFSRLLESLTRAGVERHDLLVALGGGVVGDLAGFAAATYQRGMPLVNLPTTLLAQVDASIGGKTGLNLPAGKNLVGAFWHPRAVVAHPGVLDTLPPRHLTSGLVEVVKYGLALDAELFDWLEENLPAPSHRLPAQVRTTLVVRSVQAKAAIVARDARDHGVRRLLNLGHTLGHALEAVTGFSETLYHGEAVAIGMVVATRLAQHRSLVPAGVLTRLQALLTRIGLPVVAPDGISPDSLVAAARHDKKRKGGRAVWVLPERIGACRVVDDVTDGEIRRALR